MTRKEKLSEHIAKLKELQANLKKSQEEVQAWEKMFGAWLELELGLKGTTLTLPEILEKWSNLDSN